MRKEIFKFQIPKTKKEFQYCLGSINYHRIFLYNVYRETEILYDLLKKIMSDWTEGYTQSFTIPQPIATKKAVRYHPGFLTILF